MDQRVLPRLRLGVREGAAVDGEALGDVEWRGGGFFGVGRLEAGAADWETLDTGW